MTLTDIINTAGKTCDEIGARPPKVVQYANCTAITFRNGDGYRVLVTASPDMTPGDIAHKIRAAFKVTAQNLASDEALSRAFGRRQEQHDRLSRLAGDPYHEND